ncbi:MAG TPA: hypothetical protein VGF97_08310 [Rhizomicrobium sp.]|jgi:hypothetical protein
MRTTLAIDDDVLAAAKGLAAQQHKTLGEVISALARQALLPQKASAPTRNGVPLLAARKGVPSVTMELINRLRDELP